MKYRAPEAVESSGGNYLSSPGTYHAVVTATEETPHSGKGQSLDAFRVTFQALEGTVKGNDGKFTEKDKTVDLLFWHPKLTDKNEGLFARQKQAKFFIATGLLSESQLGQDVEIDLADAVGRQVVLTLEEQDGDGERKFLQLHFSDIWHIDDPAAAAFPQCAKSKALIPKSHRRSPDSFGKSKPASQPKPKAQAEDIDLSDL